MKKVIIILFLLFIVSCNQEVEKPSNLIPRTEMKSVLKDLYLYQQVNNYRMVEDMSDMPAVSLSVIKSHGYTLEQFESSFDFYVINDAAYDEILMEIRDELKAELPQPLQDSIAK